MSILKEADKCLTENQNTKFMAETLLFLSYLIGAFILVLTLCSLSVWLHNSAERERRKQTRNSDRP